MRLLKVRPRTKLITQYNFFCKKRDDNNGHYELCCLRLDCSAVAAVASSSAGGLCALLCMGGQWAAEKGQRQVVCQ